MSRSYALAAAICDALARSAATTRAGRIAVVRRVLDSAGGSENAQPHGGRASFDSEPPAEASARHPTIAEVQAWAEAAVDRASAASRPAARVEGPQPLAAGDGGLEAERLHGAAPTAQTAKAARGSAEPALVRPRGAKSAERVEGPHSCRAEPGSAPASRSGRAEPDSAPDDLAGLRTCEVCGGSISRRTPNGSVKAGYARVRFCSRRCRDEGAKGGPRRSAAKGAIVSSAKAATTRPEWAIRDAIARGL